MGRLLPYDRGGNRFESHSTFQSIASRFYGRTGWQRCETQPLNCGLDTYTLRFIHSREPCVKKSEGKLDLLCALNALD